MTDYYLKFPSEQTAKAFFDSLEISGDYAVDHVGVIYKSNGQQVSGWHVNVRTLKDEADQLFTEVNDLYAVTPAPSTPSRVWM